jgi:hypothetical protein
MNNIIRSRGGPPMVGQRDGNWVWDGSNWVCDPDCDNGSGAFPPFGPPVFSGPAGQPPWYPGANGGVSFGATAPPNPVRGHQWWNGTTFFLFDGAAWVPIGGSISGATTPPSTTAPANPQPGQQWFNGSTLFVWDGNAWIPVSQTKTSIQATAPSAPNPGDLWFDGTQLRIWDGSAWELVGPGATVGPVPTTTKVFSLQASGTISLGASSTYVIVPFTATPSIDTLAGWNATVHKFQPTKAGSYLFTTTQYQGGAETQALHALLKNDNGTYMQNSQEYVTEAAAAAAGGLGLYLTATGMVHLNGTTDFVRLWANTTDGNFYILSTTNPTITGWLLP